MEANYETDSEDEGKLSFFSSYRRELKGLKEIVAKKVSSALDDEFESRFENIKPVSCKDDSSVVATDSEDDVPLINRPKKAKVEDIRPRRRRSARRGQKQKKGSTTRARTEDASEVVNLSSDGDNDDIQFLEAKCDTYVLNTSTIDLNETGSIDLTLDDIEVEDALVSVKINWMDLKSHRFELRKDQSFSTVFEELAKKENVPVDKILLILRDRIFISKDDTPESLHISVVDLIEGGITKEAHKNDFRKKETNKNMLEFKCMLKDRKKPLLVSIRKSDNMRCLMEKASELLECPLEKLKFKFEGEELEGTDTPDALDLEGGEVIDVLVKS